jgi:DNA-binding MurR/RpiR family transcriptional regulator
VRPAAKVNTQVKVSDPLNQRADDGDDVDRDAAGDDIGDGEAAAPAGMLTAHLRARLPDLTPAGRRIGAFVLDDPRGLIHLTVTDAADRTATSVGSVVRFCQELGLRGFQDLKLRLAAESAPGRGDLQADVASDDPPAVVLRKVLRASADAMTDAADTVAADAFARCVELLTAATHVLFIGVGTSAPLAADAAYRFRTTGLLTEAPSDVHVQHVAARLLRPGDVCLAISHTGQTRETLAAVTAARAAGAATIAVSSFSRSPLTKITDVVLIAGSRETNYRVEAMTSRLAHIAVLDAVYVAISLAQPERARRAQQLSAEMITEHRV